MPASASGRDRRRDGAGLVGDSGQRDPRLVPVGGDARDLVSFHLVPRKFGDDIGAGLVLECRQNAQGQVFAHCETDRADLQHFCADAGKLEHLLERHLVELARLRHDARVGGVDAVDVGVDVAAVGLHASGDGDRGRVGAAAAERRDAAVLADALEAGDDGDRAALQRLVERRGFDRLDAGIAVDARRADQLPAHEAACLHAHVLQRHGEEAGRDLLSARDDHVIFLGVAQRGGLAAELHEPVGLARHRRDDDEDLVARLGLAPHALGDVADALDARHRRAAEFHDDAGHAAPVWSLKGASC